MLSRSLRERRDWWASDAAAGARSKVCNRERKSARMRCIRSRRVALNRECANAKCETLQFVFPEQGGGGGAKSELHADAAFAAHAAWLTPRVFRVFLAQALCACAYVQRWWRLVHVRILPTFGERAAAFARDSTFALDGDCMRDSHAVCASSRTLHGFDGDPQRPRERAS